VPCLLIEQYLNALIKGIRNYDLTREVGLRPPRSICELKEVIAHHISTEKTKKWRVEQDRLFIEFDDSCLDRRKTSIVLTSVLARPELTVLMPFAH
ncbi:hypothetical protein ACLOJK_006664, partial [Asimina triloba]